MKINYLFPNPFKKMGWAILIPGIILGILILSFDITPNFLDWSVPSLFRLSFTDGKTAFTMIQNNVLDEITSTLLIIGAILVAFSKEKIEDEYINKLRLESLVWAVYINYGILLIAIFFIYEFAFLSVLIYNMFTILIIFIIRFHWKLAQLKRTKNEE